MTLATSITPGFGSKNYRAYALSAIMLIYVFEVVDRVLLSLIQEQIRVELTLSDLQLGLLGGPAFVLLYVLSTIPIAQLAERSNRITIIATGAALWSLATALCGFVHSFTQLFIARVLVGIGEAACLPPSHSTISSYFPANKRSSALAIFGLGIPIGIIVAAFGGGWLAQNLGWRPTFMVLGVAGIIAAAILKLTVKEPPRTDALVTAPSFVRTLRSLAAKRSYWHAVAAGALLSIYGFALPQFFVSYIIRTYGLSLGDASFAFGVLFGVAAAIGIFLGGYLTDRLQDRFPRVIGWLPALGLVISVPLYVLAFTQGSYPIALGLFGLALVFHYTYNGPLFAIAQQVAEPRARATASAIMMLVLTLVGFGAGPPLVGSIADHVTALTAAKAGVTPAQCVAMPHLAPCLAIGGSGLRIGLCVALMFFFWAALHFWLAARAYAADRHE